MLPAVTHILTDSDAVAADAVWVNIRSQSKMCALQELRFVGDVYHRLESLGLDSCVELCYQSYLGSVLDNRINPTSKVIPRF